MEHRLIRIEGVGAFEKQEVLAVSGDQAELEAIRDKLQRESLSGHPGKTMSELRFAVRTA